MRLANPKCTLREWTLSDVRVAAQINNDDAKFHKLIDLMQHLHEEGTQEEDDLHHKSASDDHLVTGGTTFMT